MDFSGKLFLAVMEEDNTLRALFRVRPLLCENGNITPEDIEELIDEGFLRVVPDKAEQHTFKERMRELGQLCLINLKNTAPDFNKVRLNKNYAPNRGENNRFVIYSDAIQGLGNIEIFEVISDPKLIKPTTNSYYLRNGGHIQGPYDSISGSALDAISCIAPDNHRLFSVSMPDEREKLFYWPVNSVSESIEVGGVSLSSDLDEVRAQRSSESSTGAIELIEEIQAPLAGVLHTQQKERVLPAEVPEFLEEKTLNDSPVKQQAQRVTSPRSERLTLHSIVDRALRHGRPDEPSVSLQNGGVLQTVDNPAEQFRQALQLLWNHSETRQQAEDDFLAMPGAAKALHEKVCGSGKLTMQSMLHQQLNQLEAERLALMMEFDHIKENRDELLKTALLQGGARAEELLKKQTETEEVLQKLSLQCDELSLKRDALTKEVNSSLNSVHYTATVFGADCSFEKASKLIAEAMSKAGFSVSKNDALNLLMIAILFPRLNLRADYLMDVKLAAMLISNAIGATLINDYQVDKTIILQAGDTLTFIAAYAQAEEIVMNGRLDACTRILMTDNEKMIWPSVFLPISGGFALRQSSPSGIVIKEQQFKQYLEEVSREIPEDALKMLEKAEVVLQQVLPLELKMGIVTYLTCAQSLLEGGIAASIDYAFACFVIPFAIENKLKFESLRSLCEAMPKASALL